MAKSDVLVRMKADTSGYDANIAKARRQLDQFKNDNLSMGGVIKQLNGSLLSAVAGFASVTAAVGAFSAAISYNIQTAKNFEKSMSQLSSLTGMVGEDLNKLKDYAIELGSTTTLSASQVAEAFKMIGSQQPQLLESGEALKEVTKYAITLAEAAGIELATAAQTLSTSINQMGGDSDNAARYINVLAAASQKGAGDIAWLGEALTKSATAAKAVGTDYEELVANLEQLAKAGFDASTAGTALRSIIMNLEKQANNDFKPSIVGLTEAFQNLADAHLTITDYQQITGKMFATQAMALANAAGEARNMTEAITGTNTAEEQANTNTDNLDGSLKALASAWEGLNLKINSSNGYLKTFIDLTTKVINSFGTYAFTEPKSLWDNPYNLENPNSQINQKKPKTGSGGQLVGTYTVTVDESGNVINSVHQDMLPATSTSAITTKKKPKGGRGSATELTEEQLNTKKIQEYSREYEKASAERREWLLQEIKVLQQRNAEIKYYQDLATGKKVLPMGPDTVMEGQGIGLGTVDNISKELSKPLDVSAIKTPLQSLEEELKNLIELQKLAWSPEQFQAYQAMIEKVQGEIGDFKGIGKEGKETEKSWENAAGAIQSVGSAMSQIEDPAAKVMGTIAQAIATIALTYAKSLEGTFTPWDWIAGAAAGLAQMTAVISAIHSTTGYAQGGIIKGNSYSGDNIGGLVDGSQFVGLNAGEVVLNASQQSMLANNLQNNGGGSVHVTGILRGEDIVLIADRWGRRTGKGELLFGKNL